MSEDSERRSKLLSLKLRALVRDHVGASEDIEGTPHVFAPGAAFVTSTEVWVLVENDPARALGGVLAWASQFELPVQLLVEKDSSVLARQASFFAHSVTVWHVDDRQLLPAVAEPHLAPIAPKLEHLEFVELIASSGAEPVVEHGVVVGEVRGLEMCKVVDDAYTGVARLEVGMGAHDREAFSMVHGDLPTEKALRQVIDAVLPHRSAGADPHSLNSFGVERLHRWNAQQNPAALGFDSIELLEPPVQRANVKDAVPCFAVGEKNGERTLLAFVHGVDLSVVPFAVDAAHMHQLTTVKIVARKRDVLPVIQRIAEKSSIAVGFEYLPE